MLETRGLTKRFGRGDQAQDAVADVSLHIREGEVYGLLGPNGAGKSTTLKMICGMLRPTAGEILFAGHAWRREDLYAIGSLIEEAPLYPNLTARENLRVRTTLLGLPESRIDEVLAAVDLADTGKKRAGRPRREGARPSPPRRRPPAGRRRSRARASPGATGPPRPTAPSSPSTSPRSPATEAPGSTYTGASAPERRTPPPPWPGCSPRPATTSPSRRPRACSSA